MYTTNTFFSPQKYLKYKSNFNIKLKTSTFTYTHWKNNKSSFYARQPRQEVSDTYTLPHFILTTSESQYNRINMIAKVVYGSYSQNWIEEQELNRYWLIVIFLVRLEVLELTIHRAVECFPHPKTWQIYSLLFDHRGQMNAPMK